MGHDAVLQQTVLAGEQRIILAASVDTRVKKGVVGCRKQRSRFGQLRGRMTSRPLRAPLLDVMVLVEWIQSYYK